MWARSPASQTVQPDAGRPGRPLPRRARNSRCAAGGGHGPQPKLEIGPSDPLEQSRAAPNGSWPGRSSPLAISLPPRRASRVGACCEEERELSSRPSPRRRTAPTACARSWPRAASRRGPVTSSSRASASTCPRSGHDGAEPRLCRSHRPSYAVPTTSSSGMAATPPRPTAAAASPQLAPPPQGAAPPQGVARRPRVH